MARSPDTQSVDIAHIRAVCARWGLEVRDARRRGVLLEVIPATLEALPDAASLSAIADALAGDGIRYVALALDEDEDEDTEDEHE